MTKRPALGLALFGLALLWVAVCAWAGGIETGELETRALETETLPALLAPVSNNAVALVNTPKGVYLYSFLGLGSGKTWRDISSAASVLGPGEKAWKALPAVPGPAGRLAGSAVSADGAAWLFGGYTVAADGSEKSTPGVYRIRPGEAQFERVTVMPVPVEDAVVLAHQDRYIYLISGWHDLGNINLVQVLDTQTLHWAQATPWPGVAVFGHSGGIVDGQMLVCDGVKIQYFAADKDRGFVPSNDCWLGKIDSKNYRRINWHPVAAHPGSARYRMAATGFAQVDETDQQVLFVGGSVNPYNFNGIGYNGLPAGAEKSVLSYSFKTGQWQRQGDLPRGTMDHRGLPYLDGWFYLIGGMVEQQKTVADVIRFKLAKKP